MNKISVLIAGVLLLSGVFIPAQAAERPLFFLESWNNAAYYDTNLEKKNFASVLGRFEGKLGLNLFNSPLQVYGAYYTAYSQSSDYWDNNLFTGAGLRIKPFESFFSTGWENEWIKDVKVFAESLNASYFKGQASAEAAGLAKTDTQYGLELWHEWNLDHANADIPWAELWSKLVYKKTNFSWTDFSTYIFYFQPKIGKHLGGGAEIYAKADITTSPNDSYWLNTADYGVGFRFEPFRNEMNDNEFIRKFKIFAEVLGCSYLKDAPTDLAKKVSSDARFGIDFSYGR